MHKNKTQLKLNDEANIQKQILGDIIQTTMRTVIL